MEQTVPSEDGNTSQQLASMMDQEDQARSGTYMILASILSDIPSHDLIDYLCHIESPQPGQDPGEIGEAWQALKQAALSADLEALDDEYHALFIGVGRGEVVQYGSWHLTGFLMDTPLSELRDDLSSLGFESDPDRKEPEDHISAICETMSILINSEDIESFRQRRFFIRHLHSWAEKFFKEVQQAKSADFYKAVGLLGERFINLENQYLNIQEH
ncbi:MAG: TorD/DmsD family molecular chaperone [bacterium]